MDDKGDTILRAAVVGGGKFGRYHAAKYKAMKGVTLIAVVDRSQKIADRAALDFGCLPFNDVRDLIGTVDIVTIATPAIYHASTAMPLLEAGIHLYIEKPIATSLEDADRILAAAKANHCLLQVGHQERFLLSRMGLLDQKNLPRFIECQRSSPWPGRGADVSSALDQMIHDIDIVLQLAPGNVDVSTASARDGDSSFGDEILAELVIGTCHARLFSSRIANDFRRLLRIEYDDGTISVDFLARTIEDTRPITVHATFGDDTGTGVNFDPLGSALTDFVRCVRNSDTPHVSGEDGRRALAEALNILAVAKSPATLSDIGAKPAHTESVLFFDLQTSAHRIRHNVTQRLGAIMDHLQYIGGPEVTALETALANFTGSHYALTVSSGTDALLIALMGERLSKGDAVFLPSFTYQATCNAAILSGSTPVFVDVDHKTCNMDPRHLEIAIRRVQKEGKLRPRVVLAVDLYGMPADYQKISHIARQFGMVVLSDAAQAFGAQQDGKQVGSLCDMTATSFYPSKTLGSYGDGGALFTSDPARYARWSQIRWHGTESTRRESVRVGINGRMNSMQAAILLAKMSIFPEELQARAAHAAQYQKRLTGYVTQQNGASGGHAYGLYTVMVENRSHVQEVLKANGIPTAVYYSLPLHRHRAFAEYAPSEPLVNTDWLSEHVLSLPFHPYLSEAQIDFVCDNLISAVSATPPAEHCTKANHM